MSPRLQTVPKEAILGTVALGKAVKSMGKPQLRLVTPVTVFGTVADETNKVPDGTETVPRPELARVPPRKPVNSMVRAREYLTEGEVERLIKAAGANRHGHRDATMILVAFRHGLRTAEVTQLRWDAIDFDRGQFAVGRVKGGSPGTHPLTGRELRALRRLKREQDPASSFVFVSERCAPFAPRGFRGMIERLGQAAGFDFPVHAHMLRHACGYKLANDGVDTRSLQAYLGHRNIQHTVRYTELASSRFKDFWND
jgi:type 1 fimbriae regulatory protein FimB/type 1 fimbriae regulatory protein FimE